MTRRFAIIFSLATLLASSALAESNRLQPDFTFRRVTAPPVGTTTNRINVQIDPAAPRAPSAPSTPAAAGEAAIPTTRTPAPSSNPIEGAVPQTGTLDWFWEAVPPTLDATAPGRLILALDAMAKAPEGEAVTEPRLSALHQIAAAHGKDIMINTIDTNVSPALALAVIAVESGGDASAVSRVGAQGLMQLMPATAARFDVRNSLDPSQNIRGGIAYLDWLMTEFDNDPILFIAAYNAGEGAIRDNNGVPNFAETRAYVPKVLSAWTVARALCITPPELMSDGCVFNLGD